MAISTEALLDEICDPLEGIVNLVYLLEGDAGDRNKVLACSRMLTDELSRILLAAEKHLQSDCYSRRKSDT